MREATIDQTDLETWAGYLLDHSLGGIDASDRVMIKGERICWPLMAELERMCISFLPTTIAGASGPPPWGGPGRTPNSRPFPTGTARGTRR